MDTSNAYIVAWEDQDGAAIDALLTDDARGFWAMGGGPSQWLADKATRFGAPVKGQGRVLRLTGGSGDAATAQTDVAVVYDCRNANCPTGTFSLDWVLRGRWADADSLTLRKQADGKWLITYVVSSSYFSDQVRATEQAQAYASSTAQALSYWATQTAVQASVPTQTPVPTLTPTPVPVYLTAKTAYQQVGIAAEVRAWADDAILFRVWDRAETNTYPFDYNPEVLGGGFGRDYDPLTNGDGTSRQWLYWVASPKNKEVKVYRVLDGKLDRADVSAALYRNLFAAQALTPTALDFDAYIDSDEAVKLAREHGYQTTKLRDMYVQLASDDLYAREYTPSHPAWNVVLTDGAFTYKAVVLNPHDGEVNQNDF
ncbi:MAG: hypothetical protein M3437_01745 [Chloroflexota bacterium]|nr:hypothetical protein [Chloroflexota bacterium]MDQ5865168.1 hypothetical protein [Chloroflexota bacterium]